MRASVACPRSPSGEGVILVSLAPAASCYHGCMERARREVRKQVPEHDPIFLKERERKGRSASDGVFGRGSVHSFNTALSIAQDTEERNAHLHTELEKVE